MDDTTDKGTGRTGGGGRFQLSRRRRRVMKLGRFLVNSFLLTITSASAVAVLFIFIFIARDAIPFFRLEGFKEFFTSTAWYPSREPSSFGALAIIFGSAIVTAGSVLVAVPLGVMAAVCLSDVLPFKLRQVVKPVIEILAAIPSVAFGFFALVVVAPVLQDHGGRLLAVAVWLIGAPVAALCVLFAGGMVASKAPEGARAATQIVSALALAGGAFWLLWTAAGRLDALEISSGTNALNVSVILGIMALPTVVSVSEDALQAVGRGLREGAYALGATRAETILKVVIPAAMSGIGAAAILGTMRAVGETMVVWMASGNAAQIPEPWYNLLEPIRTLTATIAGEMGEADHVTGSARYHVLFAMALLLVTVSFVLNVLSEWAVRRERKKLQA